MSFYCNTLLPSLVTHSNTPLMSSSWFTMMLVINVLALLIANEVRPSYHY